VYLEEKVNIKLSTRNCDWRMWCPSISEVKKLR